MARKRDSKVEGGNGSKFSQWIEENENLIGGITFVITVIMGIVANSLPTVDGQPTGAITVFKILFSVFMTGLLMEVVVFMKLNARRIHQRLDRTLKIGTDSLELVRIIKILNDPRRITKGMLKLLYRRLGGLAEKIENSDIKRLNVRDAVGILRVSSGFVATSTRSIEWLFEPNMLEWLVCQAIICKDHWLREKGDTETRKGWEEFFPKGETIDTGFVRYFIYNEDTFDKYREDIVPLQAACHDGFIKVVGLLKADLSGKLDELIEKKLKSVREPAKKKVYEDVIRGQFALPCYPDFILFLGDSNNPLGVAYRDKTGRVWIRKITSRGPYNIEGSKEKVVGKDIVESFGLISQILKDAEERVARVDWLD